MLELHHLILYRFRQPNMDKMALCFLSLSAGLVNGQHLFMSL